MKQVPYRLAEALENICKRKSLESITVSLIAKEAGVTRQVFYRYFDDKFELASWVHYAHLYRAVKNALEEDPAQVWRLTMKNWLDTLEEKHEFYMNAFQSVSQREFQRIIRTFYFGAYRWQMEKRMKRPVNEEESFVLKTYLTGGMESIYEWVAGGMVMPAEQLVDLLELAMPELLRQWILSGEDVPYEDAIKKMEQYLSDEGLLRDFS